MKKVLFFVLTVVLFQSCFTTSSLTVEDQQLMETKLASIKGEYHSDGRCVYVQKVIEVDGTKDEIYVKLLEYLTRAYNDANEVVQVKEKADGVIICKGCFKFYVKDISEGSSREETAWHIYKAEIKDRKLRVTLSIDEMESYYPGFYSSVPGSFSIPASRDKYSILDCPPFKNYEDRIQQVRKGYILYHSVSKLLGIVDETKNALTKNPIYDKSDNW